ncbi:MULTISPECIES: hypothetical protein [Streptomyces]|uniref:RHIM domain-containing protein n=2 Tax=Streptomyces TaxID=1883 RepID=A0ABV9IV11_9ACTN
MDPVTLVTSALLAGASTGLTDAASAAVRDACHTLRQACTERLPGRRRDLGVDETHAIAQELVHDLADAAALDPQLVLLAQRVMALADPEGTRRGVYQVAVHGAGQADLRGARGVQLGDHNSQHNTFH